MEKKIIKIKIMNAKLEKNILYEIKYRRTILKNKINFRKY
jgi:hypothetical protein